jgi:hypothetical protein
MPTWTRCRHASAARAVHAECFVAVLVVYGQGFVQQGLRLKQLQLCMQVHGEGAAQQMHHPPLPPPLLHIRSASDHHHHHLHSSHSQPHLHDVVGLPIPGSARRTSGISGAGFGTLQLQSSPSMDTTSCRWVRLGCVPLTARTMYCQVSCNRSGF